ncbi:hypothetical protein RUM44_003123 [Polyplax serrata]|uniref:Uncharacterized protein n=1 Tax=Polyplax serrata TaxID=468196 RepID=A0ABR1AXQ9_POLSC
MTGIEGALLRLYEQEGQSPRAHLSSCCPLRGDTNASKSRGQVKDNLFATHCGLIVGASSIRVYHEFMAINQIKKLWGTGRQKGGGTDKRAAHSG